MRFVFIDNTYFLGKFDKNEKLSLKKKNHIKTGIHRSLCWSCEIFQNYVETKIFENDTTTLFDYTIIGISPYECYKQRNCS